MNSTTVKPPSSSTPQDSTTTDTAMGVGGAMVFFVILGIILYWKQKCGRHNLSRQSSTISQDIDFLGVKIDDEFNSSDPYNDPHSNYPHIQYKPRHSGEYELYDKPESKSMRMRGCNRQLSKSLLIDIEYLDMGKKLGEG